MSEMDKKVQSQDVAMGYEEQGEVKYQPNNRSEERRVGKEGLRVYRERGSPMH